VTSVTHPLYGLQLAAIGCAHRDGKLKVSVLLPDGSPALIEAALTDVFGESDSEAVVHGGVLSVGGVRRLRAIVDPALARAAQPGRPQPRPWRVVQHSHGADPFGSSARVLSSHSDERSALKARERERTKLVRSEGHVAGRASLWRVIYDPAGLLSPDEHKKAATKPRRGVRTQIGSPSQSPCQESRR